MEAARAVGEDVTVVFLLAYIPVFELLGCLVEAETLWCRHGFLAVVNQLLFLRDSVTRKGIRSTTEQLTLKV